MSDALEKFLGQINRSKLRVKRPSKFIFLCGGVIGQSPDEPTHNLRDYLWRCRGIGSSDLAFVLAESAQQLYRDSGYKDLITFEEDVARIAAVVLVISESAGSLAELGAFCSNPVISPVLRVLISEENFDQESFIRWGPVERVLSQKREHVGVYPWSAQSGADLSISAEPHFEEIVGFIRSHAERAPTTMAYPADSEVSVFYDILWAIYLSDAINPTRLFEIVKRVHPSLDLSTFRKKTYALRVANWISVAPYGGQDYFYLPEQQDPFEYSFIEGVSERDKEPVRRVLAVREAIFSDIPAGALARVRAKRGEQ